MIVVRIELHIARTGRVKEIGRMLIANVGGSDKRGDYQVRVLRRKDSFREGEPCDFTQWKSPATRTGEVKSYPRLAYNVWRLVARALKSAFPEEA